jgi:hypothetical protein
MYNLNHIIRVAVCFFVVQSANASVNNNYVGMVLDVQGSGQVIDKDNSKLEILTYLKPLMQISLSKGSKATLSLYSTRSIYQLTGPTLVAIEEDGLTVKSGAKPIINSLSEKLVLASAKYTNPVPGAYRMRGMQPAIAMLEPIPHSVQLNIHPVFRWEASEASVFEFQLQELSGKTIFNARSNDNTLILPANIMLENGKNYSWTVSYTSSKDGRLNESSAIFSMISSDEAAKLNELKPSVDASIEEWVMYATTLQDHQITQEAKLAWQHIANQRPDLEKAKELAQ